MGAFAAVALVLTAAGERHPARDDQAHDICGPCPKRHADPDLACPLRQHPVQPRISALLYGIRPTYPATFAAVTALLLGVALAACWLPTRAAMRVDPAVALRTE